MRKPKFNKYIACDQHLQRNLLAVKSPSIRTKYTKRTNPRGRVCAACTSKQSDLGYPPKYLYGSQYPIHSNGMSLPARARAWRMSVPAQKYDDIIRDSWEEEEESHTKLYSLRFSCKIVSLTAAKTNRMFSVSITNKYLRAKMCRGNTCQENE